MRLAQNFRRICFSACVALSILGCNRNSHTKTIQENCITASSDLASLDGVHGRLAIDIRNALSGLDSPNGYPTLAHAWVDTPDPERWIQFSVLLKGQPSADAVRPGYHASLLHRENGWAVELTPIADETAR